MQALAAAGKSPESEGNKGHKKKFWYQKVGKKERRPTSMLEKKKCKDGHVKAIPYVNTQEPKEMNIQPTRWRKKL